MKIENPLVWNDTTFDFKVMVTDFDNTDMISELTDNGIKFEAEPWVMPGFTIFFIKDVTLKQLINARLLCLQDDMKSIT